MSETTGTDAGASLLPVRKVAAGAAAGAATVIIVWAAQTGLHIEIPAYVGSALTTLISFVAGYLTPKGSTGDHAG